MASDSERRFEILSAVLIALSSLIGAFVAWRAFAAGTPLAMPTSLDSAPCSPLRKRAPTTP